MTPWKQLNTFCVAARHESFKFAANELCLSPSAVSHQLRNLERALGVELFERRAHELVLTLAGRNVYQRIQPHFDAIDDVVKSVRAEPDKQSVHIKIPEFFASELFIPRVAEFSQRHRNIELRIETTRSGITTAPSADLAIVLSGKPPSFSEVHSLFPIRYVPACAMEACPDITESSRELLARATLLVHEARPDSWQKWADAGELGQLNSSQIIRFDSMLSLVRATEQGLGIGLLPVPLCKSAFDSGRVRRLSSRDFVTTDFYYLISSRAVGSATRQLMDWILATFTDMK